MKKQWLIKRYCVKVSRNAGDYKKIFPIYTSNKRPRLRIYEELLQLSNKKIHTPSKKMGKRFK